MTNADLIAVVAEKPKFPWGRAELEVDQIFGSMVDALQRGEGKDPPIRFALPDDVDEPDDDV